MTTTNGATMETLSGDQILESAKARMKALEPYVAEYARLERVVSAFAQSDAEADAPPSARRPRARKAGTPGRASRRREQALALVMEKPGITVAEVAERMQIGTTYLYRLLPRLERDGEVRKVGRGYEPAR